MVYWNHLIVWGLFFCPSAGENPFRCGDKAHTDSEGGKRFGKLFRTNSRTDFRTSEEVNEQEVPIMRVKVTLACTECKRRNYVTKKNKRNNPERIEMNKHCKFCRKHTLHSETK